jgi:polar amino acid transport system substrate-binding protein
MNLRCFLFLVTFIFPIVTFSQELLVVTENWVPFNYYENGEVKGTSTEIVKNVLDRTGIKYKIKVYPWARAYKMALEGENILIYTLMRIPQREKLFKWVTPLGKGGITSLYKLKKNKNINPTSIEEAKKYSIGTNNKSMDHLWLMDNGFTNLVTPSKTKHAIKMFFRERFNLLAFNDEVIAEEFNNIGLDPADAISVMPLFRTPPYMALSLRTSDDIRKKIQKAYDELLDENKIKLVN